MATRRPHDARNENYLLARDSTLKQRNRIDARGSRNTHPKKP